MCIRDSNAGLADPQIQAKGDTLYVTGEQVKYRDSREGKMCIRDSVYLWA